MAQIRPKRVQKAKKFLAPPLAAKNTSAIPPYGGVFKSATCFSKDQFSLGGVMGGRGEWLGEWVGYVAHTMGVFSRRRPFVNYGFNQQTVRAVSIVIRALFLAIWGG